MHEPRATLRLAYEVLLSSRDMVRPDGRPLYEYGFSRQEFETVAKVLRTAGARFLSDPYGRALFVAYTAEWFRRVREGGHWDWVNPLASLNVRYHPTDRRAQVQYPTVRTAADAGLASWRRRVPQGLSILHAVIAESGFPASSVRQGIRLARWLKRSVLSIEAGFAPEEAVTAEAWRAPASLVQTLFGSAVALCRAIVDLRASVPEGPAGLDAVQRLDLARPEWRKNLPFDLEEQDVRRLVEDLVRAQREEGRGLDVIRRLRRTDAGWAAYAELSLVGALDHRRLPGELRVALEHASRVRLRPGGALAERGRVVAALERATDEEEDRWDVRPLVQGCDLRLDLGQDFRLQAIAGESVLAEFIAFAGDPLAGPVIALEPSEGVELDEIAELIVLGTSPARTPHSWLVLAVEPSAAKQLHVEGERLDLGELIGGARTLVAFNGRAELELDGERLAWCTRDERREALRLNLVGDTVRRIEERVFAGCPNAWIAGDEVARAVGMRELIWRSVGSRNWTSVMDCSPVGRVELAVRRKGVLVAWTRAEIVPAAFKMKADARSRTLRLTGMGSASVAASGVRPLPCRREGDMVIVDLADHSRGAMLRLRLRWDNIVEMCLPDPITEPVLLDPNNRPSAALRLAVGRLSGYRLLAPSSWTLLFELRRRGTRPVYATRTVDGLAPLASFAELIRELLGGCEELDACVRLSWVGREERLAEIGWYDLDRPLTLTNTASPFSVLATTAAAPKLVAFSVVDPHGGVVYPPFDAEMEMRNWLAERAGEGPWLLSGTTGDGRRLRPKVLDDAVSSTPQLGLIAAFRHSSRQRRDAALDGCLADAAQLSPEEIRHLVELSQVAARAEIPCASVDALCALARAPRAAVFALAECVSFAEREAVLRLQSELPMLWCTSAIEDWIAAFSSRRARLAAKLKEIGEAVDLADASIARALGEIVDLQPALRVHAQGALLLSGAQASAQAGLLERLCRPADSDLEHLTQEFVKRHAEGAEPPRELGLTNLVASQATLWTRYDLSFSDVIAAPLVAAGIAMGEIERAAHLPACRSAWLFDRDYFEAAVLGVLFKRAHS